MKQYPAILIFWLSVNAFAQVPGTEIFRLRPGESRMISSHDTTGGNNDRINIPAGKTAIIFNEKGPGIIQRMWITIDSRDPDFLRKILLRMYWDDETTPSVEAPVGDFFGCGFQYKHHLSQYVGMSSGGYYIYFPMPFQKAARIEIVNDSFEEVYAFYYQINFSQEPVDAKSSGYFHVQWSREIQTDPKKNFVALKALGEGRLVGLSMNSQSYNKDLGFLEGDEMIYVDGESKPSVYGTGTEDYFTSGWYFKDGEFSAPYHGLVLMDQKLGRVTAYRHHIPDPIPFKKSIEVTFEHGDRNAEAVDMSTVVYWYQKEPHGKQELVLPPQLRQVLRRPLPVDIIPWKNIVATGSKLRDMSSFGPDWRDRQLMINLPNGKEQHIEITGMEETDYDIEIFATAGRGYTSFTAFQGNQSITLADTIVNGVSPLPGRMLKNVKAKKDKITFSIKGDNEGMIGMDGVRAIPHRKFITDWYLIGPYSNLRKHDYDRPGLDFKYPPESEIELKKTYKGVNDQDITWIRYTEGKAGYEMGLRKFFKPDEMIITYVLTYIFSPTDQTIPMLLGTDDAAKAFLNDKEVYRFFDLYRIASPDQDRVDLALKKGWNKLLLKLENNFGGYAFYVRLIDANKNLIVSAGMNK